jgi:predicted metal-dependent hydrolase
MNPFDLESEKFRILFGEQYKLAEQFEAAAQQIADVERSLHGTGEQPGLAELLLDAAVQIRGAASTIQGMNLDGFSQVLVSLSNQIAGLPGRLLKPADEMDFRASLREGIAQVLADSIVDAKLQVESEAVDVAVSDLVGRIKAAMAQLGESSANYFAERNQLKGLLEAEKAKSAALAERMKYFEQDKDNALRLLSAEFVQVSKRSGKARLIDFGLGVAMALIVSLGTLYPSAANYLKAPSQNHQQR